MMVHSTNLNRNNIIVNLQQLPLLCENSRAVHLVLVGLVVGWMAGWLAYKILVNFKIFKIKIFDFWLLFTKHSIVTAI